MGGLRPPFLRAYGVHEEHTQFMSREWARLQDAGTKDSYLHYRSSGSYEALRKSGITQLPSGKTLRDYQRFMPSTVGLFSKGVDQQLLRQTKPSPSLAKYIGLIVLSIEKCMSKKDWC